MSRWIVPLLCLAGCSTEATLSPSWAGSVLRIVEPLPASVLPIEASHRLVAEVTNIDGDVVEVDGIDWVTSGDPEWAAAGSLVEDGLLPNGAQELTAEVILPNGDRLAHTIGDVRVQSRYAGTYAGLFSATVDTQGVQAPCSGAAVVVVDVTGESATGDASCVAGLQGFELELQFIIDVTNDDGNLQGVAAADLFGFFQYDFDAEGSLAPEEQGVDLVFGGNAFDQLTVDGRVVAPRVSMAAEVL